MTSDLRLIDRFRVGLYALPLPAFALLAFAGFGLVMFILATAARQWDPGIELSLRGSVIGAAIFGVIMAAGSVVGERSRRGKFAGAHDRAEYQRAVDREVLPDSGIPMHWREQLLTENRGPFRITFRRNRFRGRIRIRDRRDDRARR